MIPLNIFEEIAKLVEYIPIYATIPHNGKFMEGISIDSQIYLENTNNHASMFAITGRENHTISLRDIVRLFNKFLTDARWDRTTTEHRYNQLKTIGCTYPVEYLLFDFCLAALEGDYLDARLYLAHSFHILELNRQFSLLLSVIVNESLTQDKDVRELLTLLARATKPRNAEVYVDTYGNGFRKRYETYIEEQKKLDTVL
jgi:hypothetical protein